MIPRSRHRRASFVLALVVAVVLTACSFLQSPKGVNAVYFTASEALCIFKHDADPIPQIITECDLVGRGIQEVTDLMSAQRAGEEHHAKAARARAAAGEGPVQPRGPCTIDAGK